MARQKPVTHFCTTFEVLESRELMAADTATAYSSSAFLASVVAGHETTIDAVGGVFLKLPTATQTTPAPTPASVPKPAPLAPVTPIPAAPQPNDWYTATLHDLALRNLVRQEAADNVLGRQDMLNIFAEVELDGTVTANEVHDLQQVVGRNSLFTTDSYVQALADDVVLTNPANAHWQGLAFGNLGVGSSGAQLNMLVGKWFLGVDHPATMSGVTYQQAAGSLFPHAPVYSDVRQGLVGDCYFLSSLAETAQVNPSLIANMFIVNGDGTYTVKFNHNGAAEYVTVDSMLPVNSSGSYVYDGFGQNVHNATTPLWVAMAEKAYAQLNESGWLQTDPSEVGRNSYAAIAGGYMFQALNEITGMAGAWTNVNSGSFTAAFDAGQPITFATVARPSDASVIGGHAYSVISYNKATQQVTLFNPWGVNNGYAPALVTLTWAQMKQDFFAMEYAV